MKAKIFFLYVMFSNRLVFSVPLCDQQQAVAGFFLKYPIATAVATTFLGMKTAGALARCTMQQKGFIVVAELTGYFAGVSTGHLLQNWARELVCSIKKPAAPQLLNCAVRCLIHHGVCKDISAAREFVKVYELRIDSASCSKGTSAGVEIFVGSVSIPATKFVLYHELGHVVRRYRNMTVKPLVPDRTIFSCVVAYFENLRISRAEEYACDIFACQELLAQGDIQSIKNGIAWFNTGYIKYIAQGLDVDFTTHPPDRQRAINMQAWLDNQ